MLRASFQIGSSYVHLDENTYPAGDLNSLMTPTLGFAEVIHTPGPITLGTLTDMGWGASDRLRLQLTGSITTPRTCHRRAGP